MSVDLIIEQLKASPNIGTKTEIANICGVSIQAVRGWKRIPSKHVRKLEMACGREVTRYFMRPDVFGPGPDDESDTGAA